MTEAGKTDLRIHHGRNTGNISKKMQLICNYGRQTPEIGIILPFRIHPSQS